MPDKRVETPVKLLHMLRSSRVDTRAPQGWTAHRPGSGRFSCAAAPQQEAESPTASRDDDAGVQLDEVPPGQRHQRSGNGAARPPMLTTLEQYESIDALDSVQTREAIIEDRGEWVFTLVGAALAFGVGVWAVLGEQQPVVILQLVAERRHGPLSCRCVESARSSVSCRCALGRLSAPSTLLDGAFAGPEKGAEYFAGYLLEQSLSGGRLMFLQSDILCKIDSVTDQYPLMEKRLHWKPIRSLRVVVARWAGKPTRWLPGRADVSLVQEQTGGADLLILVCHSRQPVRFHPGLQLPQGPPRRPEQGERGDHRASAQQTVQ